jgi:hypothetical protein
MRAILIDPERRTFTEIQMSDSDDYKEVQAVLRCRSFTTGAHLQGSIETGFDAIYVSDDSLEERDDPRFWFQADADRDPPSSYPIAGLGLAMGVDEEGGGRDVRISVEELTKRITFTQRKFRGFESRITPGGIAIDMNVPIIDGADENKPEQ